VKPPITVRDNSESFTPNSMRGIGYMLVFAFSMSAMIAVVRHVSQEIHPFEAAFFRAFFGFLVFVPILATNGTAILKTQRIGLHGIRSLLHVTSILLFFYGVSVTPLAKAMSISFSAPLFASVLAMVLLGEILRIKRLLTLLLGFVGVLVVLRPGFLEVNMGLLAILGAAVAWGSAMIAIKKLSDTETSLTSTIYSTIFISPITFLVALTVWQTPDWQQFAWLALVGGLGSLGHLALAEAMKEGDVVVVLPADFTKLIWAAVFGYLFFAEIPDWGTWFGGAVIFLAISYIAYQEHQDGKNENLKSQRQLGGSG
jgi:drug/metabolite transporter (DMT)-like permease